MAVKTSVTDKAVLDYLKHDLTGIYNLLVERLENPESGIKFSELNRSITKNELDEDVIDSIRDLLTEQQKDNQVNEFLGTVNDVYIAGRLLGAEMECG